MIRIPKDLVDRIYQQARVDSPYEACGYLAGIDGEVKESIEMTNVDHSTDHFSFDPKEQFDALKKVREAGWCLIGVYHSHPASPPLVSAEDIRLANDPGLFYVVFSLPEESQRAFRIDRDKRVEEIPIVVG
jgi:proteasome lid subunit RPN8/RPN11